MFHRPRPSAQSGMNPHRNGAQSPDASPGSGLTGHDSTTPPSSSSDAWPPAPPLDSHTHSSLRQASVALDVAYERITQLRDSISILLNRVSPDSDATSHPQPRLQDTDSGIGPGHSALVLSGGGLVEELNLRAERLRSLISPSARQRLEDFETARGTGRRESFQWERFLHGERERPIYLRNDAPPVQTTASPQRSRSPPLPDLMIPRFRNASEPRSPIRRDFYTTHRDESSTMIGRRVAARVGASSSDAAARSSAHTAHITHELQNMADRLAAQRRADRTYSADTSVRRLDTGAAGLHDSPTLPPVGIPFPSTGPNRNAEEGPLSGERFSRTGELLIDNNPTYYLPLSSPSHSPANNSSPSDGAGSGQTLPEFLRAFLDPRNAQEVRERLQEFLAREPQERPAMASQTGEVSRTESSNTWQSNRMFSSSQPQSAQTRRRRGWMQLNADGDEVASDDEESPHTRRLRMRPAYWTYGMAGTDQQTSRTAGTEGSQWRMTGVHEGSGVDAIEGSSELCAGGGTLHAYAYRPYPLPTPVEEMLAGLTTRQRRVCRSVPILKNACVYGR